ncbi:hypothetical protein [Vibrio sp. HN007]|uniref:hypothetical protein n=1 Tax=Vibrio iocasae TaxID=3098914 RepID=UPI0035D48666
MKPLVHKIAAVIATLCIATFFSSTLIVELFGSMDSIRQIKALIVFPGLYILVPAIAVAGATGSSMAKQRKGRVIDRKKKRMPIIAANGLLILIPAAILLNQWAEAGSFDTKFYIVQAMELLAGLTNLSLMVMNIRDGQKFNPKKAKA